MSEKTCSHCGNSLGADSTTCICLTCECKIGLTTIPMNDAESVETVVPGVSFLEMQRDLADTERPLAGSIQTTNSDDKNTGGTNLPRRFGDYELLVEIARGGMGVVYKAKQVKANRVVALKMILKGDLASADDVQRFYVEARAAANLRHPNIVPVYDVGEHDGQHYFAMGYVEGQSLAERLKNGPLPPRESVQLITVVSEAVAYAHERGTVHRDLKPANVLIDLAGQPMITDFGLAKNRMDDSGLTANGQILGTPSFMPPEQALGHIAQVGPLADVYSLGATLYHLLTGRPPFLAASVMDTLQQVLEQDPVPPSQINAVIDKDLETICLKCLQKEQSRRYASANELVADLSHWFDGKPISARPVGRVERTWRWCRRNPLLAILGTTAVTLLVLGTVVSSFFAVMASRRESEAVQLAQTNKKLASDEKRASEAATKAQRESELRLIDMYTNAGLQADKLGRPAEAILWFSEAAHLSRDDAARQQANQLRCDTWSRTIPLPIRAFRQPGNSSASRSLGFHESGRYLMIRSHPGICAIWDIELEKPLPLPCDDIPVDAAAWSPDGRWLVLSGPQQSVNVYRFPEGELLHKIAFPGTILDLEFNSQGSLLALAGDGVRVWNCRTFEFASGQISHANRVAHVTFNQRGDKLATASSDGLARVYQIPDTGVPAEVEPVFQPVPHVDGEHFDSRVSFKPVFLNDGKTLVTRTDWETATCWSSENGEKQSVVAGVGNLFGMCSSPNGRYLAIYGFAGARFWDATSMKEVGTPMRHSNFILGASFSRDGQAFLTVSGDRTSGLWDVPSGAQITTRLEHQDSVQLGSFSPDGQLLATIQCDNLVRIWKRDAGAGRVEIPLHYGDCGFVLSPDGQSVFPADWQYTRGELNPSVFDITTGLQSSPPLPVSGWVNAAAFSPDGHRLLTASSSPEGPAQRLGSSSAELQRQAGMLKFWRWRHASLQFESLTTTAEPVGVAFSPDGTLAVAVCAGGQILMIDATTGKLIRQLEQQQVFTIGKVHKRIRFSPDGKVFATWLDTVVRLWKTETGELQYELKHDGTCYNLSFSNDSRFIATASTDKTARVWNVADGQPAASPLAHPDWVFRATFSPDGELLVTGAADHMARIWNWRTGKLSGPTIKHDDQIFEAHFMRNGRYLFTASRDTSMRFWDVSTSLPVTPTLPVHGWPLFGELIPDHSRAIVSTGRSLQIVDEPGVMNYKKQSLNADSLQLLGQIVSGKQIHERGGLDNLTSDEWLQRWQSFRSAHSDYQVSGVSAEESRLWHDTAAQRCEVTHNAEGAVFHLDGLIQIDPRQPDLYRRRCIASAALAKWDRASDDLLQAVDLTEERLRTQPQNSLLIHQLSSMKLEWIRASQAPCPPSRNSSKRSFVVFENRTDKVMALHWVDVNGARHPLGKIGSMEKSPQVTYSGHSWLVADEQEGEIGYFIASDVPAQAVITGK